MMENLRSPSLAGIVSDPTDAARRLVPASQRPDGSTRKQLRVRPGYVPAEDVAKFKVGQGSVKQQLASARENHQAPSPSSAIPSSPAVNVQVKRPSDFVPKEPRMYPQKQQQQQAVPAPAAFKSGAETSRWASSTPSTSTAAAAPATPVRISKQQPVQAHTPVVAAAMPEAPKSQEMSSRTPSLSTPATAPANILKFSPSGSDLPPDLEGEWWDDELDSTADALQGINLDSAPVASTSSTPPVTQGQNEVRGKADKISPKQQKQQQTSPPTEQTVLSVKGRGKAKANGAASERQNGKKERQKSQSGQGSLPMQRGRSNDKPQQQHPPASAPPASQGFPARTEQSSGMRTGLARLSLSEITERARVLGNDLREARQLKRYASSGAVLKPEQSAKLQSMDDTLYELEQLRDVLRTTVEEVEKSMADSGK